MSDETLPVRHRRAAHAVPVREARPTSSSTGCASDGHVELVRAGLVCTRGRPGDAASSSCSTARSRCRAASAPTTSRSAAPTSAASTPAPGRPTSATASPQTYPGSTRALTRARIYVLAADDFAELMQRVVPDAAAPARGAVLRQPAEPQTPSRQRERLLALGSLSAGLTHELNNPAAAAVRATSSLRERVAGMRHKLAHDRRRRVGPQPARDADPAAGARGRAWSPRRPSSARSRRPTARTSSATGSTTTASHGGYDLAPTFVAGRHRRRLARPGRRHRRRRRCSRARCAG